MFDRGSGILLHITSLPGKYGVGDIGGNAYKFIDFLNEVGCKYWQFLPVVIPGKGNSPYQGISAFAGNPILISPKILYKEGYINNKDDLKELDFYNDRVEYRNVKNYKQRLLAKAFNKFKGSITGSAEFQYFCDDNKYWLDDFAMFSAFKLKFRNQNWTKWPDPAKKRDLLAINTLKLILKDKIIKQKFIQFIFFKQWKLLKDYAASKNIKLIGDLPLYISHDSVDVWRYPDLFKLDKFGNPLVIAGVPPDYFSAKGQLWENPVYDWEANKKQNYIWWNERINKNLELVDLLRLDHFRGFSKYWEVFAIEKSAIKGNWVDGPGIDLFKSMKYLNDFPNSKPFIAEDLGNIDDEVISLREELRIPGMKIIQFLFDDDGLNLEIQIPENCFLYTGTHDNNTVKGWLGKINETERRNLQRILNKNISDINSWEIIEMCWDSNAKTVIAPIQDLIALGSKSRMNIPGVKNGNWTWRMEGDMTKLRIITDKIHELNHTYKRI